MLPPAPTFTVATAKAPVPVTPGMFTIPGSPLAASATMSGTGVVEADLFFREGETIRPVQVDGDRRGFVIALGSTNLQAVERAEAAAKLLDVEVRR